MNNRLHLPPIGIVAAERDTGISKETLRIWERRYGFPMPERNARGERLYPAEQIEKLNVLRQLIELGHRPGKIAQLPVAELLSLVQASAKVVPERAPEGDIAELLALLYGHHIDALRLSLSTLLLRYGLERFVIELAAPLTERVGDAWACGKIEVFEEHLHIEHLGNLLRRAISALSLSQASAQSPIARPRVLLTTFPQEPHGLGLLMVEALLALHGCACLALGTQTPLSQIVRAADTQRADIVALSFSSRFRTYP